MFDSPRPARLVSPLVQQWLVCGTLALVGVTTPLCCGAAVARLATRAHAAAGHADAVAHLGGLSRAHSQPPRHEQARISTHQRMPARQTSPVVHTKAGSNGRVSRAAIASATQSRVQGVKLMAGSTTMHTERVHPASQAYSQQAIQDRVHAWYAEQRQTAASSKNIFATGDGRRSPGSLSVTASTAPERYTTAPAPIIRMSPTALQNDEALHATAAAQPSDTSTDDNAAITEESHIPSTAPTERTAAPFMHGDFIVSGPTIQNTAAPVLRAASPAASALLANKARLDPVPVQITAQQSLEMPADPQSTVRLSPADQDAANAASVVKVNLYDGAGKLVVIPPMKGTHEILVHQNQMAEEDGLQRITTDAQLNQMRRDHLLAALPETAGIGVDERLPLNRRYARPWSVRFLSDLARAHYAWFHTPLIVTSAVRTVAFQRHLVLVNGNAAPPTGEIASPHLYGQAVDIAKHSMSVTELAWMRAYLTPLESQGKIDVEEEFQQACFHISVYRSYVGSEGGQPVPPQQPARAYTVQQAKASPPKHRHLPTALLATGLR